MTEPATTADPLDEAILKLLAQVPQRWEELNREALSALEDKALFLLTGAGLIERKFFIRAWLIGHPVQVEVTALLTGEKGLAKAMDPVFATVWNCWEGFYRQRKDGPEESRPMFFCQRTAPEQWRLNDQGVIACQDVAQGRSKVVLDFVHRRTAVFYGKVVPGYGRAERIEKVHRADSPTKVEVTNLSELSGPLKDIAAILQRSFDKASTPTVQQEPESTTQSASDEKDDEDILYGQPEVDPHDDRVVYWLGKRLYLGRDSQVSRLFWLLAEHVGRPHDLSEIQRLLDGFETSDRIGSSEEEIKKAMQRVRKAVSTLRKRMREAKLDTHFMIVREGSDDYPNYTMVQRFGKS